MVLVLAASVAILSACNKKTILVWGPDDHKEVYEKYLDIFAKEHKDELEGYHFEYAGSGDSGAYDAMAIDPRSGAGVYTFANDQTANLRNLGALAVINGENYEWSVANNIATAVESTKLSDGKSYAYPLQADNGYYVYYNKAAFKGTDVWDPNADNVDGTKGDLRANYTFRNLYKALDNQTSTEGYPGKSVNWKNGAVSWPIEDSWYASGVFFAVGGDYNVAYDKNGKQINADAWFSYTLPEGATSDSKGVYTIGQNAYECMKNTLTVSNDSLTVSPHFVYTEGSYNDYYTYYMDVNDAQHWGQKPLAWAICGTWKAKEFQEAWGENYACTVLPTLENDNGDTFAMKNFAGFKNLGVNPQCKFVTESAEKGAARLQLLHELAQFLCGPEISVERYQVTGAGPANNEALKNEEIAKDAALLALNKQYDRVCLYPKGYSGWEYEFETQEVTEKNDKGEDVTVIKYTRKLVEKKGDDPVGNGKGFRTQDSVPANYWTPIQNFSKTLYQEVTAGKLDTFSPNKIIETLARLQFDIQNAAQ